MTAEIGHFALIAAFIVAILQTALPLYGARRGEPVSLIGVKLHILVSGGRFDIATREAHPE